MNATERQGIPVVRVDDDAPALPEPGDITTLLTLFDATSLVRGAQLAIFESNTPGAEYALRLWASARAHKLEVREYPQNEKHTAFAVIACDVAGICVHRGAMS